MSAGHHPLCSRLQSDVALCRCWERGYQEQIDARRQLQTRVAALEAQRDEAQRLLAGALRGHGAASCTFRRGEMADLEMALYVLENGASV